MFEWLSSFFTETSGCSKPVSPIRKQLQKDRATAKQFVDKAYDLLEEVADEMGPDATDPQELIAKAMMKGL